MFYIVELASMQQSSQNINHSHGYRSWLTYISVWVVEACLDSLGHWNHRFERNLSWDKVRWCNISWQKFKTTRCVSFENPTTPHYQSIGQWKQKKVSSSSKKKIWEDVHQGSSKRTNKKNYLMKCSPWQFQKNEQEKLLDKMLTMVVPEQRTRKITLKNAHHGNSSRISKVALTLPLH